MSAMARKRTLPLRVGGGAGEGVDAVVLGVAAVALDPVPFDSVARDGFQQFLPQVGILDRLAVGGAPAIALPAVDPAGDAVADVDAVGGQADATRLLERVEGLDRRLQLHAVVGGQRFAAG